MRPLRSSCAPALLLAVLGSSLASCSATSAPEPSTPAQQGAQEPSVPTVTAKPERAEGSVAP